MTEVIRQLRPYVRPWVDTLRSKIATMRQGKSHMNGMVNGMAVTETEVERPKDEVIVKKEEKRVMYQVFYVVHVLRLYSITDCGFLRKSSFVEEWV